MQHWQDRKESLGKSAQKDHRGKSRNSGHSDKTRGKMELLGDKRCGPSKRREEKEAGVGKDELPEYYLPGETGEVPEE